MANGETYKEPHQPEGIEPLRILPRTTGGTFVYDPRLPLGSRTVDGRVFLDMLDTIGFAQEVAKRGAA